MKNKRFTIELYSILKDVIKNLWVVVLTVLIAVMGFYIASRSIYTPQYTSYATLVVSTSGGSGTSNYVSSVEIANIFTQVFVEPTIKSKAADLANKSSFNGSISAEIMNDTNFIQLKVTSSSPQDAYELLSAVLKVHPEVSDKIFSNAVITVLKQPSMPRGASNGLPFSNRSLIVSACVVLSLFAIVLISVLRDTVKNEDSFNEKIDAKLLGAIPHERKYLTLKEYLKKKKKSLLINGSSLMSLKFVENYHKIAAKIEYLNRTHSDKVFAVTSVAENEGKSTIASNLAISLAARGNRVILIDLDVKKPAIYKIFEEKYQENSELSDLFSGKIKYNDFRLRRYKKTSLYLALNTSPCAEYSKWFADGEIEKILNALKDKVDYIIVDTAPMSADSSVTDIVKIVDKTIMAVRTDVATATAVNDALITVSEVGGEIAGCILNDVYPEITLFGITGNDEGGYYYSKKNSRYGKYYNRIDVNDENIVDDNESDRLASGFFVD